MANMALAAVQLLTWRQRPERLPNLGWCCHLSLQHSRCVLFCRQAQQITTLPVYIQHMVCMHAHLTITFEAPATVVFCASHLLMLRPLRAVRRYNHNQVPNPYDEGFLGNCASVWCVRVPPSKVQFR